MKLPVVVVRVLKRYYAECGNDAKGACRHLEEEHNQKVPVQKVKAYLDQKAYRDRRNGRREKRGKGKKRKSNRVVAELQKAWAETDGVCPERQSTYASDLARRTGIPYSDIQQWFGQRRYARSKKLIPSLPLTKGVFRIECF